MREIKFRAYIKHLKTLVNVDLIDFASEEIEINTNEFNIEVYRFDEIILMQYTGLYDKNGAEIYEGDILELINDSGRRILAICKFGSRRLRTKNRDMIDIQCFYFEVEGRKTNPMVCNYKGVHDLEIMEVIGNISELLEGEE